MGYLAREGRTAMAVLLERGHSQSSIARLLGVSEGTVRFIVSGGLRVLVTGVASSN